MKVRIVLVAVVVAVSVMVGAGAADQAASSAPAKRADIRRLLELSGSGKLGVQVMGQLIGSFRQMHPNVPEKFWRDLMAQVDPGELIELCIPSYDKHLTHDEIKQLIQFYESPVGRKLVEVQPQMVQECMVAGQEWGRRMGEKVARELQAKGYTKT